jgi:hypothetical protein
MTTETDEFTKRRAIANHSVELVEHAYAAAATIQEMRQHGLSTEAVLREVAGKLRPREAGILHEDMLVDVLSPLLSLLISMLVDDGTSEAERMKRAFSGIHAHADPDFVGTLAKMDSAIDRVASSPPARMKVTIKRLFSDNPSPLPDQAPALECWVTLAGIPMSLQGALSETPEGGLRLMSVMTDHGGNKVMQGGKYQMIEQFFCYEDVTSIAVRREVSVTGPRIIQSS